MKKQTRIWTLGTSMERQTLVEVGGNRQLKRLVGDRNTSGFERARTSRLPTLQLRGVPQRPAGDTKDLKTLTGHA